MTLLSKIKQGIASGLSDAEVGHIVGASETMVAKVRELGKNTLEKYPKLSLPNDTEILNFLQQGHCVLAICAFDGEKHVGTIFEVDGYQGCPRDYDLRKAVAQEMLKQPKGNE